MTRIIVLMLVGLLAACSAAPPPAGSISALPPADLQVCPDQVYAPPPPRAPRTIPSLVRWATQIEIAREKTAQSLAICSQRMDTLNLWILKNLQH